MSVLNVFNTGIVRQLCSTETNVSPKDMEQGKWIIVNMPLKEWGESARFVMGGWKYLTQRHILKRHFQQGESTLTIWSDECQNLVNSYDSAFLAECRSHGGNLVFLTQSLHSYMHAMKNEHATRSLLANFGTKIFHNLNDEETAKYASAHVGDVREVFYNTSTSPNNADIYDRLTTGANNVSVSVNEQYQPQLRPHMFTSLMQGGPSCGFMTEAYVIRSERFNSGEKWQLVRFPQR